MEKRSEWFFKSFVSRPIPSTYIPPTGNKCGRKPIAMYIFPGILDDATGGPKIDSGKNCFPLKVANQLATYFYPSPGPILRIVAKQPSQRGLAWFEVRTGIATGIATSFKVVPRLFTTHPHSYNNDLQTMLWVTKRCFYSFQTFRRSTPSSVK